MNAGVASCLVRCSNPRGETRSASGWMVRCRGWLMLAVLLVSMPAALAAADDEKIIFPGAAKTEPPPASARSGLNSMSLILAAALAGVGGWMFWRNRRATAGGKDLHALAIDETRSLGNRQYLVVASYEGKKFLLGVCPGRIDMLSSLSDSPGVKASRE
jgi:flagellar protein FliO/FliZ